jgi:hypothetical protein
MMSVVPKTTFDGCPSLSSTKLQNIAYSMNDFFLYAKKKEKYYQRFA